MRLLHSLLICLRYCNLDYRLLSKPLIVYWSTNASLDKSATFALLELEPKPILSDVIKGTVEPPQTYS